MSQPLNIRHFSMRRNAPNHSLQATRDGGSCFPTASGCTSFGPARLSSGRSAKLPLR
jgi:hypothetical protein